MQTANKAIGVTLIAISLATSGCSLIFVKGAPSAQENVQEPVDCTRSRVAPTVDLVLTINDVSGVVANAVWLSQTEFDELEEDQQAFATGLLVGGIVGALVFMGSSAWGYSQVKQCEEYNSTLQRALRRRASQPESAACRLCTQEACGTDKSACENGDDTACYRMRACQCRCKLDAGGCGEAVETLEACEATYVRRAEQTENEEAERQVAPSAVSPTTGAGPADAEAPTQVPEAQERSPIPTDE